MAAPFRLLPNGARRLLPDGRVRSLGADGLRYTDVAGSTGLGVVSGGGATAGVYTQGVSVLVFSLSGNLTQSGFVGSARLALTVGGVMSSRAYTIGASHLAFSATAIATAGQIIRGEVSLGLATTGSIVRTHLLRSNLSLSTRVQGRMAMSRMLRGTSRLGFSVSGNLTTAAGGRWRDLWRDLYAKRQAVLNAIDAKNRLLATNAGNIATATAGALVTTNTNVTNLDGRITAEAARITALQSTIEHPTTGLAAAAAAVSSLTTRVGNVEGVNTAQASSITSLTTTVGNHTTSINSYATSINGLQGKAGLSINANGHVTGWALNNNGSSGSMVITANTFRVVDPSNTYNHMEFVDGNLNVSGIVKSSLVTGSALAQGATRINCGEGRLAPFTIRDSKYYISPGTNASRTLLLDGFVSPSYGSGYDFKRFARNKMDVWIDCQISGDTGNETAYIEVQYDGGAWSSILSVTFNCNYRGSFPIMIRYTTLDSWSTAAFRLRTTQNRTEALRITVDVANYNESGNSAGSNSGATGGGSTPPVGNGSGGAGGDDGGVFCVDYETTLLPDGRHIYEMEVGEAAQCWNQDGENPAVILMPLRAMKVGYEKCYQLFSGNTLLITQSESTPMVLRDGRVIRTSEMRGEHVLLRNQLEWIEVTDVVDVGVRKVAMPDFADSMFFAGVDADRTIATHNVIYKPIP